MAVLILYVFFFYKFLDSFIRLSNTVGECQDYSTDSVAKVAAVMLLEVLGVVKARGNKVQVLLDNIEVAGCKAASEVEFRKESLQFSGVELCCAVAVMERLGICYKRYDILKRLIIRN